jgi:hypothetical protein
MLLFLLSQLVSAASTGIPFIGSSKPFLTSSFCQSNACVHKLTTKGPDGLSEETYAIRYRRTQPDVQFNLLRFKGKAIRLGLVLYGQDYGADPLFTELVKFATGVGLSQERLQAMLDQDKNNVAFGGPSGNAYHLDVGSWPVESLELNEILLSVQQAYNPR